MLDIELVVHVSNFLWELTLKLFPHSGTLPSNQARQNSIRFSSVTLLHLPLKKSCEEGNVKVFPHGAKSTRDSPPSRPDMAYTETGFPSTPCRRRHWPDLCVELSWLLSARSPLPSSPPPRSGLRPHRAGPQVRGSGPLADHSFSLSFPAQILHLLRLALLPSRPRGRDPETRRQTWSARWGALSSGFAVLLASLARFDVSPVRFLREKRRVRDRKPDRVRYRPH